jgi:hypothetical protein
MQLRLSYPIRMRHAEPGQLYRDLPAQQLWRLLTHSIPEQ